MNSVVIVDLNQSEELTVLSRRLSAIRDLIAEYGATIPHHMCAQGLAEELAGLPGEYAPPDGGLWLAEVDGVAVGSVALRRIDAPLTHNPLSLAPNLATGEVKRLYVRLEYRGRGVGRHLMEQVIREARTRGYRWLFLDTLPQFTAARALYHELGFRVVAERGADQPMDYVLDLPETGPVRNPIIVALDLPDLTGAVVLAKQVAPYVGAFKVGKELFVSAGPEIVRRLRATGAAVFLDLKFHDIPTTVAKAVAAAVRLDVQMLTIHTSGGSAMMRAAEAAAQETARTLGRTAPLVLGVTVLTSLDAAALAELGGDIDVARQVERLARLAISAGLRGLVCSPLELTTLRSFLPLAMELVAPGIRTGAEKADDQKRTMSPQAALHAGATWLVIGRPITAAPDPAVAARTILGGLDSTSLTSECR